MSEDLGDTHSTRLVWWPTAVYIALLAVGIPWYWPADNHLIVLGMPGWVIVAIVVSFVGSVFTAWLLWPPWPDESSGSDQEHETSAGDPS